MRNALRFVLALLVVTRSVGAKAKSPFSLVSFKNQPIRVSSDGKSISPYSIRSIIGVTAREGGGGQVNWMTYLGGSQNPEADLEKLFDQPRNEPVRVAWRAPSPTAS